MITLAPNTKEPRVESWEDIALPDFAKLVIEQARQNHDARGALGPTIIAINGRSGAGKSTLTRALAEACSRAGLGDAAILEADDLMWWEPMWQWAPLAIDGVFEALRRGQGVALVPPMWREKGREGSIEIPQDTEVVIFEGVGASQIAFAEYLDASIWVQSDYLVARRLGLARDIAHGGNGDAEESERFWDEWDASECAFLEEDMPWHRADFTVLGTSERPEAQVTQKAVAVALNQQNNR